MYEVIEETNQCEKCREETNQRELARWEVENPNVETLWHEPSLEKAKILKDTGYYQWKHPKILTVTLMADCHGDGICLCRKHFEEWANNILERMSSHE